MTLTISTPTAAGKHPATHSRRSAKVKTIRIAQGTVRIPAGRQRPLILRLNRAGRRALDQHARLSARLTLVARGPRSTKQTRTRPLTIKRRAPRKR